MSGDFHTLSLKATRDAIADGSLRAVNVTRAYLDRIEILNPTLNAYHEVFADRALHTAQRVDAGEIKGPLAGVPLAIKDNLCTDFGHTTCSSKMLADFRSPYTATAVRRLEEAGAVILGKTNMDEFAMGSSTETCVFGVVRNPWDTRCVPGGSSGGSAAAVAAGLCAAALGSDTGGSIRQPASFCGIVGLKPTYGRISRWGLIAFASSLDQIGPLTRTTEDAALLMQVMSGQDELDSTCAPDDVPDYSAQIDQPINPLRIGLPRQYLSDKNHPTVAAMMDRATAMFKEMGATLVEIDLPHTEFGIPTYYIVAPAEASSNLARYDGVRYGYRCENPTDLVDLYSRSRSEGFGDEVKRRIMLGTHVLCSGYYDAYYTRALRVRRLIKQDFDNAFASCDVVMCPTTTGPAFPMGQNSDDPLAMYLNDIYTVTCNLAGLPGISLPGGFVEADGRKLPVGLQLLGPVFEEARLLRVARMHEKASGLSNLIADI
ncbi:MAG: Asp-tRNA(Asn)/Glu-tRNA(Gln) amidotransferase subunit GatA [Phycisphaera sp.]|nr:Asp-tRNA(Asn)/Glu-tRNA(Gln) amidotransferase subunit GatA [Phycisphaera sp.]